MLKLDEPHLEGTSSAGVMSPLIIRTVTGWCMCLGSICPSRLYHRATLFSRRDQLSSQHAQSHLLHKHKVQVMRRGISCGGGSCADGRGHGGRNVRSCREAGALVLLWN